MDRAARFAAGISGLNRTSVGLKPDFNLCQHLSPPCLNRTSVGLKLGEGDILSLAEALPQSNQRGIETATDLLEKIGVDASLNRTSVGLKPVQPRGPP